MLTLKELEDWFEDLWNIIVDLHISINNAIRLKKTTYQYEEQIKTHGFFEQHWYQLKFIMIVQLAKLYGDNSNQKRSFHKLFNRLINEKYDESINNLLKENENKLFVHVFKSRKEIIQTIEEIKNDLVSNEEIITKVIVARDEVYAHSDPNKNVKAVTSDELKTLIDLSADIYNKIRGKLLNIRASFTGHDWDIDFVLRQASENRKRVLEMIDKKKRGG